MSPCATNVIPDSRDRQLLCRIDDRTCGGCCWGSEATRRQLEQKLERHRRTFARQQPAGGGTTNKMPSALQLLLHELRARRGLDLLLALLQWVPWLGPRLTNRFAQKTVCAFAAFETDQGKRVGCLLHPTRWHGTDVRRQAAFRLLRGFGCGAADFTCSACDRFSSANNEERAEILQQLDTDHWYHYSRAIVTLSCDSSLKTGKR